MRILFLPFLLLLCACSPKTPPGERVMNTSISKIITALDPALAADTASQYMTASFYDTPLQYNFRARPYRLEPSMLRAMPEVSPDGLVYTCRLRDDLFFQPSDCFRSKAERKITADDFIFSILRLADPNLKSPGFWLVRGRIRGIDDFHKNPDYRKGCPGLRKCSDDTFQILLKERDPRFLFALAMPYFSVVSRKAVQTYGPRFADLPAGSGPFRLAEWKKDFRIVMTRYRDYREEYFKEAENKNDRTRKLPLLDRIVCSFVRQPLAGWLLFLQGELDQYALDGENFSAVVDRRLQLSPALTRRGISLLRAPESQTNYIGFHFADPLLGKNENLRRAVSLAFNRPKRIEHAAGRWIPAYGPVPPGTDGWLDCQSEFTQYDPELAKRFLTKAGYPGGVDPATGKHLTLSFDQAGSDTFYRQTAELLATDLKKIGINLRPEFNNRARFLQKIAQGRTQLFRLSWTGDYPDAENFLQLFYSPNAGGSNRVCCSFPEFDAAFRRLLRESDPEKRRALCRDAAKIIAKKTPWIFESHTVAFILKHCWITNCEPHDFCFNRWKYFSVEPDSRSKIKLGFTPLSMGELAK